MTQPTARSRHFEIAEWQELPIGPEGASPTEAEALWAAARGAASRMKLPAEAVLLRTHTGLRAGQVCGMIVAGGVSLEILPKVDGALPACRRALVRMLAVAEGLPVSEGELAELAPQGHDLLDLFIDLFASRLSEALRGGLDRAYAAQDDLLPLLRGRLDLPRQMGQRPLDPSRLHCRFDELSEATPLNRLFKSCLLAVQRAAGRASTRRRIADLLARFDTVPASPRPLAERIRLDRASARFGPALQLARFLLAADWQSTTAGGAEGLALLFPMNHLFERYVATSLCTALPGEVTAQATGKTLLTNGQFRLIPDLMIATPGGPLIIDTKWKRLDPAAGEPLGVAQSDLYQLAAYGTAHQAAGLILLYPSHAGLGQAGLHRNWSFAGTGLGIEIWSLDLIRPLDAVEWLGRVTGRCMAG